MQPLLLGIDIGTTAAKAALFGLDGRLQAVGSAEYPLYHIRPGWVEQQPEEWWQATVIAIRQALSQIEHGAERIAGICVSAQAPTLIALDANGQPLRPALIWMDRRAEAQVAELENLLGTDTIYRVTGNRPDAFYVAAKHRWYMQNEPEHLARTQTFLQITGYINYRLTGLMSLDTSHAALLQLRDYATGEWSTDLMSACGVEPRHFPPARPAHEILGGVSPSAAEATGLRVGTPVVVGTVDGAAAALEAGAAGAGVAAEMTGTSTVMIMPNDKGITESAFIAMPHALPGINLLLGAMVSSGASLRWFRDQFADAERETAAQTHVDAFDLLTAQAAQVSAGSDGLIFLPYMMGERSPLWNTNARGVLFGLSLATPKAAVIRAILEGTAYALRHNVEVAQNAGVPINEVRSVGGGTRSTLWNQIKSDVLGVPVLLPEASVGAPFGDALVAGLGVSLYTNVLETVRDVVKIKTRYEPDPANHARYTEQYALFRSIYEHLRTDFDQAARLMTTTGDT